MPTSSFIDFKAVKAAIDMEQIFQHYHLLDKFKRSGDSLSGPCPIHKGSNATQFRVSISKNLWNCFGECKSGGNALDFIARMEDVSIHAAALKAIEWFNIDAEAPSDRSDEKKERPRTETRKKNRDSRLDSDQNEKSLPVSMRSKPLGFSFDHLAPDFS